MDNERENRKRLVWILQILMRETDEEHPMSTTDLIRRMRRLHKDVIHRITLTKEIDTLRELGFDIGMTRTQSYNYYLKSRTFDMAELKLLIDAVEASKFITPRRTKALEKKLTSLVSVYQSVSLKRNLYNSNKIKSENEFGMDVVDTIHTAINEGKQISFRYIAYSIKCRRVLKNNRSPYFVSPYRLIWNGDYYYLVGYNHQREQVNVFRVDRIEAGAKVLDEDAVPCPESFDLSRYTKEVFRMFSTDDPVDVTLRCDLSVMNGFVDRFGTRAQVTPLDESTFLAKVSVCTSPTFYSWVFQWGGKVEILEPEPVAGEFQRMLAGQIKNRYREDGLLEGKKNDSKG